MNSLFDVIAALIAWLSPEILFRELTGASAVCVEEQKNFE